MYDLLLRGGRVIDPGQGIDARLDVAVAEGRIAALAEEISTQAARQVLSVEGLWVVPGLIDAHVHVHWGVSHYGVDPDLACLARGVTTAIDAGSAGAYTYPSLKRFIIGPARTRIYALLNIATAGMFAEEVGELEDLRLFQPTLTRRIARDPHVLGLKARLDRIGAHQAADWLDRALELANELNVPLMVHIGSVYKMHNSLDELLPRLRPGDIVTHIFHGHPGGILEAEGRVRPCVWAAHERGVILDVGHGMGSFSFAVARAAVEQGLWPDLISSDVHTYSVGGPAFDLVTTMAKFLHLGLSPAQVIERTTLRPAQVFGLKGLGTLTPGAVADITVLALEQGAFRLYDCVGEVETGTQRLAPRYVVRGGRWSACA